MSDANPLEIKEKVFTILKQRGPSLPIHISQRTGLNTLFASAFLSELISERKVKVSYMKIGNSPLYLLPGQEPMLERFAENLKKKEKDAFLLLKSKNFLKDINQHPAIRVALRSIRDFAIPFKTSEGEIIWRYFISPETNFIPEKSQKIEPILEVEKLVEPKTQEELNIFEEIERKIEPKSKRLVKKRTTKKKTSASQKKNEKFFNKIKMHLAKKSIEIIDIESFNKNDLVLKVQDQGEEKLLIAYNKKRITELDIIKASKKGKEANLKYIIFSLGEPLKKINTLIEALQNLSSIEKVE